MSDQGDIREVVEVTETISPRKKNVKGKVSKIFETRLTFSV